MAKTDLTSALAREFYTYNSETGELRWRIKPCQRMNAGDIAGCINGDGYLQVAFKATRYPAHRVIWLYVYGEWPDGMVDHINGVRTDNRIANLRNVSAAMNQHNRRHLAKNNTSGFTGVRWFQNAWRAGIWLGGKYHFIGYFKTAEEAGAAYVEAKRRLHAGCTI